MARVAILACALVVCGCSPYGGGDFACTTDSQCGPDGKCSEGFCSFPDPDCNSGFRYGDLSGPQSNQCVGAQQGSDAGSDMPSGHCYGTGLVTACFADVPTGQRVISAPTVINTDTSDLCTPLTNGSAWCVIAAQSISVQSGFFLAAGGSRPLVLVATDTISIDGGLSVASLRMYNAVGAGADMPGCNAGVAPTGTSGGAGGSFGGAGGAGAAVGTPGMPGATLTPTTLRGGCSGQPGSDDVAPNGPGAGGHPGGAVYLIADMSITVNGGVSAAGEGGGGGGPATTSGAGGGGSGGFIGFDTPALTIAGAVWANGGGGGEASGAQTTGVVGGDSSGPGMAGAGGAGGSAYGTDGGNGSVGTKLTGDPGAAACTTPCVTPTAGGGGGGGAGIIKVYRAAKPSGANVSPPAT